MTEEAEQHFKSAVKRFEQRLGKGSDDPFTKYYMDLLVFAERATLTARLSVSVNRLAPLRAINTLRAKSDPDFENVRQDSRFRELIGEPTPKESMNESAT